MLVIVLVIAAAAGAAIYFFVLRDNGKEHGGAPATPTPTASASSSATSSASPTVSGGPYLAAATGARANLLSTVSAAGSVSELTSPLGAQVEQVAWSPDGQRLACIAGAWNRTKVWLADATTGDVSTVQIASPAIVSYDSVAWLDATRLLVAGFTVQPANTGEVAELLIYNVTTNTVEGTLQDSQGIPLRGVSVSASADGARIAYVTYTDQKTNNYGMPTATERLELFDRGSSTVTELGTGKAYFDVNARRFDHPLISPDGEAVIYRSAGSDVGTSYTVVDANGATLMPAVELNFPAGYAWDPSGQKVMFTGHALDWNGGAGPVSFYLFDRSTGGAATVVARYRKTTVQDLSWSPDGSTIAFSAYDQQHYQTGTIYLMSPSGSAARVFVEEALFPAFRPAPGENAGG